jgi:RNA 3'-terminal phosphate cyclase (ATP)
MHQLKTEVEIDGSFGEGGGQILRTALSLALLTQKSFRIKNLRAGRKKPGLRPQHLAAVKAALKVSGSRVEGDELGSREICFFPAPARAGNFRIDIGTAGSTGLVFQTLLPALIHLDQPSQLQITGGTHNPQSPCFDFLKECFLPLLAEIGIQVQARILRHGFYPRGGGEVFFSITPFKAHALKLQRIEQAFWQEPSAEILLAGLEQHIAEREAKELVARLKLEPSRIQTRFLPSDEGPGNAILLRYISGTRTEIFTGYGEPGKRAERVAGEVAREAGNFCRSRAQIDAHLADQLLLYLAMGTGGEFTTNSLTSHFHTNLAVIRQFLKIEYTTENLAPDLHLVKIAPAIS